jgi:hypothetical protein
MPKLHPRELLVKEAERKVRDAIYGSTKDLTVFERISVVTNVLTDHVLASCKYGIRLERHGDPNKPGGLADG